jgi:hypothetical protein
MLMVSVMLLMQYATPEPQPSPITPTYSYTPIPEETIARGRDFEAMLDYASNFNFEVSITIDPEVPSSIMPLALSDNMLRFVMSEDDAADYIGRRSVAWATEDTQRSLDILNEHILAYEYDLEPYSLSYPVTMDDIVNRWRHVDDLMRHGVSEATRVRVYNP